MVDSYDPTGFVRGHAVPVTYRINQGDVEVQLDGGWTRVPYYVEGVALRFVPQLVMAMHLPGDPLGSVLPPFGWAGSTTFQLPLTRPGD